MIKNKRLKPEVEKSELELFRKGQFVIEDEEKEDATAVTSNPPEEKKVIQNFNEHWVLYTFITYLIFTN